MHMVYLNNVDMINQLTICSSFHTFLVLAFASYMPENEPNKIFLEVFFLKLYFVYSGIKS